MPLRTAIGLATFAQDGTVDSLRYTVRTTAALSSGALSSRTLRVVFGPEETDQLPTF